MPSRPEDRSSDPARAALCVSRVKQGTSRVLVNSSIRSSLVTEPALVPQEAHKEPLGAVALHGEK